VDSDNTGHFVRAGDVDQVRPFGDVPANLVGHPAGVRDWRLNDVRSNPERGELESRRHRVVLQRRFGGSVRNFIRETGRSARCERNQEEDRMAVRKICKQKGCRASPRCDHPWWFDVMHQGKRWRMPVDDFALTRGATETITSKQTAERVWEPKFQDPPLLSTTPFHRFGVSIRAREETKRDRRIHREEEQAPLTACVTMSSAEHKRVGPAMHDRLIGALETCCRQGEMLRIRNRDVDWAQHQIVIHGANAKDHENRRIPFDPHGRLAPILKRRAPLGPQAFVFGSPEGEFQDSFKTAWESLLLVANGHDTTREKPGTRVDRAKLRQIDLHWHDLRHEGACRLLADGVDIRNIQLMLGHSDIKTTKRYLNITDEELRKALTGVWERRRQLRAVNQ